MRPKARMQEASLGKAPLSRRTPGSPGMGPSPPAESSPAGAWSSGANSSSRTNTLRCGREGLWRGDFLVLCPRRFREGGDPVLGVLGRTGPVGE